MLTSALVQESPWTLVLSKFREEMSSITSISSPPTPCTLEQAGRAQAEARGRYQRELCTTLLPTLSTAVPQQTQILTRHLTRKFPFSTSK